LPSPGIGARTPTRGAGAALVLRARHGVFPETDLDRFAAIADRRDVIDLEILRAI
jgi:hypothetical protein